jgi:alanine racemase
VIYPVEKIKELVNGTFLRQVSNDAIEHLLLDSRKVYAPSSSLFFALKGPRRDGHQFIPELYKKGIRNFVVSREIDIENLPLANIILTGDTLQALQILTAAHRRHFAVPVIGITGSNGKTIVKEWLYQLLHKNYSIVRSPKSYNSQIGVPLSVWQMDVQHTLGIFEAGISQPAEMQRLEAIIQPTIGILTNIGEAHSEGFADAGQKIREKLKLFAHCKKIIFCKDYLPASLVDLESDRAQLFLNDAVLYSWSRKSVAWLTIKSIEKKEGYSFITAQNQGNEISLRLPFTDDASVENAITCCCTLLVMGFDSDFIAAGISQLQPVNMRLEMKKGMNQCSIINDSYSADLSSLEIALNFIDQQFAGTRRTAILSDFLQSSLPDAELYSLIIASLKKHQFSKLIGIGEKISAFLERAAISGDIPPGSSWFWTTEDFIRHFRSSQFRDEIILVKGARVFGFEKIVQLLEQKVHQTILEINLNAIVHNLKAYQQLLRPETKIMVMVKAFAYGSGGTEIAGVLQFHKADYLGVAYADEGVELRNGGISLPVMIMNPEESSFDAITDHELEPDIYSFNLLQQFDQYLTQQGFQQYPIHLEVETGMNRLGFAEAEIEQLADYLLQTPAMKVQSVFTHFASSEDANDDGFTRQQYERFEQICQRLEKKLGYRFLRHIANSAAIVRHPAMQLDMVRLGIGLYGVNSAAADKPELKTVATLKSTIAQLKKLKPGESVSYNRKGVVMRDSIIATIRIGYADGYPRRLGNGTGKMLVHGRLAPVIGAVCMDMTMIDVTDIPGVKEGDEVIIFGEGLPVEQLASWAQTIPYEIMTGISQRVKRVYFEE